METGSVSSRLGSTVAQQLHEYLLVVHPDMAVQEKLLEEQQWFSSQYKEAVWVKTKPYIAVAQFLAKEEMESTIIRWMHRIISNQNRFTVTLDRYSGFKPHTIYLRVQNHAPFQQLARELQVVDQYVRGYGCPEMHLSNHPHLTIARRLPETVYHRAEAEYAQKKFQASFEVNELVMLRREPPFESCKQVNVFGLRP